MSKFEIKNILTPTDFSATALLAIEHSAFMARISKATLHLLHVIKISEFSIICDVVRIHCKKCENSKISKVVS